MIRGRKGLSDRVRRFEPFHGAGPGLETFHPNWRSSEHLPCTGWYFQGTKHLIDKWCGPYATAEECNRARIIMDAIGGEGAEFEAMNGGRGLAVPSSLGLPGGFEVAPAPLPAVIKAEDTITTWHDPARKATIVETPTVTMKIPDERARTDPLMVEAFKRALLPPIRKPEDHYLGPRVFEREYQQAPDPGESWRKVACRAWLEYDAEADVVGGPSTERLFQEVCGQYMDEAIRAGWIDGDVKWRAEVKAAGNMITRRYSDTSDQLRILRDLGLDRPALKPTTLAGPVFHRCPECDGDGQARDRIGMLIRCPRCGGSGLLS